MGSHGGKCLPLGFTIPFPKCGWPKHVTLECFDSHRIANKLKSHDLITLTK